MATKAKKKAAPKKTPGRKASARKAAAGKGAVKRAATKKTVAKKPAAKKAAPKKAAAKKATAKKSAAKRTVAKKPATKRAAARKAAAPRAAAKPSAKRGAAKASARAGGPARNKQIVGAFFASVNTDGFAKALEQLRDDATWWSVGGTRTKDEMIAVAKFLDEQLAEKLQMAVSTMTAEDDRVAVEAASRALRTNGTSYANVYHFLFQLKGGAILSVREHCDTAHAAKVWSDVG